MASRRGGSVLHRSRAVSHVPLLPQSGHHRPASAGHLSRWYDMARGAVSPHRDRQAEREEHTPMLAVHEHEARPCLSALDDHDTQGPTLAHDDDVLRVLTLDERSWEEPDTAGAPLEEAPTSERGLNAADPETDQVLARYFGEVRQFALLSFAEEQALGRRITRWQRRVRWALYAAP